MPAQVAVRSGRRVVNPPWALFLNVVDIVSVGRFYNFMQAQRVQAHPTSSANLLGHRPRSAPRASSRRLWRLWRVASSWAIRVSFHRPLGKGEGTWNSSGDPDGFHDTVKDDVRA